MFNADKVKDMKDYSKIMEGQANVKDGIGSLEKILALKFHENFITEIQKLKTQFKGVKDALEKLRSSIGEKLKDEIKAKENKPLSECEPKLQKGLKKILKVKVLSKVLDEAAVKKVKEFIKTDVNKDSEAKTDFKEETIGWIFNSLLIINDYAQAGKLSELGLKFDVWETKFNLETIF